MQNNAILKAQIYSSGVYWYLNGKFSNISVKEEISKFKISSKNVF